MSYEMISIGLGRAGNSKGNNFLEKKRHQTPVNELPLFFCEKIKFGKHKGTEYWKILEDDPGYFRWAYKETKSNPNHRITIPERIFIYLIDNGYINGEEVLHSTN